MKKYTSNNYFSIEFYAIYLSIIMFYTVVNLPRFTCDETDELTDTFLNWFFGIFRYFGISG